MNIGPTSSLFPSRRKRIHQSPTGPVPGGVTCGRPGHGNYLLQKGAIVWIIAIGTHYGSLLRHLII